LYKRGEKEKATVYNSYTLKNFTEYSLEDAKPEEFLDSVLMEFVAAGHLLPHEDQTNLLTKAQEVARFFFYSCLNTQLTNPLFLLDRSPIK